MDINYQSPPPISPPPVEPTKKSKKVILLILSATAILLMAILGYALYCKCIKVNKNSKIQNNTTSMAVASLLPDNTFVWGVATNPYAFNTPDDNFSSSKVDEQIDYWKDLGINGIRFNYEFSKNNPSKFLPENDYLVNAINENNIIGLMVIESPLRNFIHQATYLNGYTWGKNIATHFKGKVKYYQMLNEVSGTAIKPNYSGNNPDDYDPEKYKAVKEYLLGMSKGIREVDPEAQRVVSANWLGTAIIDKLISDGVEFEIIGWNWFSDMGNDPTNKQLDDGTTLNIPAHFSQYKKKFWVTEVSRAEGSYGDQEQAQADYLNTFITNVKKSSLISGIFVYRLFNTTSVEEGRFTKDNQYGLVSDRKNITGKWGPGIKKKAYKIYKAWIAQYASSSN